MLLLNATAFIGDSFHPGTNLLIRDGRIVSIGSSSEGSGQETLDLNGDWLIPGFVDVHIHAFMGMDTMDGEEAVRHMSRELYKHGVAAFLPTTMSASAEKTRSALAGIQAVMDKPEKQGAVVLGAHMEAPFLSVARAGAQQKAFLTDPNYAVWNAFTGPYEKIVRMVTLAPELEGAMEFIRFLCSKGIVVSLGHTDATAETTHAAADAGAMHVTHLFNAQAPLHHRSPGVIGAALADDRLVCECICDGIHLHPDIIQMTVRCKGSQKAIAVTDAMEAAGMPDGVYQLGGQRVNVHNGEARLHDGTLAGSTLTMCQAFQNLIYFGISPSDAAAMTTTSPARSIQNEYYGKIEANSPAFLLRFEKDTFRFCGVLDFTV